MSEKDIVSLFVSQVTRACQESGEPLPSIVKNHKTGDDRLYRTTVSEQEMDRILENLGPQKTESQSISQLLKKAYGDEFDQVNNNTDELEIF